MPKTSPTLVVHGVLNPRAVSQVILLERTLTGTVSISDTVFDVLDPIVSAGGIAVSGATVEVVDSTGKAVRGVEDRTVTPNGEGAGVYRVPIPGNALVLGAAYQLRVRTLQGEELTATTRIPGGPASPSGGITRVFNRDHDMLGVQWNAAPGARTYAVRIESPFGPFFLFTDSVSFRTTGDLRNLFSGSLEHVFVPGFRQDMLVAAVDANFYDYYRTNNDPFTGAGIISRVTGGLGLFGSMTTVSSGTISVTADQTEPIEGRFRLTPASVDQNTPTTLTLYVESPPARADQPAALSGHYLLGGSPVRGDGIVGTLRGPDVSLALLANQLSGDTVDVFVGELTGDTLRGAYQKGGRSAVFVRSP